MELADFMLYFPSQIVPCVMRLGMIPLQCLVFVDWAECGGKEIADFRCRPLPSPPLLPVAAGSWGRDECGLLTAWHFPGLRPRGHQDRRGSSASV